MAFNDAPRLSLVLDRLPDAERDTFEADVATHDSLLTPAQLAEMDETELWADAIHYEGKAAAFLDQHIIATAAFYARTAHSLVSELDRRFGAVRFVAVEG